jgi:hypothetical protein
VDFKMSKSVSLSRHTPVSFRGVIVFHYILIIFNFNQIYKNQRKTLFKNMQTT